MYMNQQATRINLLPDIKIRPARTFVQAQSSNSNATKRNGFTYNDYSWALGPSASTSTSASTSASTSTANSSKLKPFILNSAKSDLETIIDPWAHFTAPKKANEATVVKPKVEDTKDKKDTNTKDTGSKDTTTKNTTTSDTEGIRVTKITKGKKKMPAFAFFKGKAPVSPPGPKPKYPDPAKAAIIKSLEDNATYDTLWTLCWEVNLSFMTSTPVTRSCCLKCNSSLADSDGKLHSGFVSVATYSDCGHSSRRGFSVCKKCDEDLLFDITTVGVGCFEKGCKEELKVDRTVVSERLSKERPGLLDEYFALLNTYHVDTFECAICLSEVDRRYQPKGKIAPGCKHAESSCCLDCIKSMIDSAVRNAMWGDLKCPELDCQAALDSTAVKRYASETAYAKWEKFQLMKALEGDEEFRWCPGENFTCGHGQLHPERDTQPRIICSECDTHHCYTCRVIWHRGETCAQYQANLATSQSEALILKTTKKCPARGCGVPIEKQKACLEVSHRGGCGTNFCWDCKAIVGNDIPHSERVASRHFSTCKAMEVRHCDGVVFVDKPPREGNGKYREGWAEDLNYERNDMRDGEHMYCKGCTRPRCNEIPNGNTTTA